MNRMETHVRVVAGSGRPAIGTWLSLGSAGAAEILGRAGFDWLLIDQQHSAVGPETLLGMIRAINLTGRSPIVRIPKNEPNWFDQALDSGAHGVMVPMISDEESARQAVSSAQYPPSGDRSIGGYRAQFSFDVDRDHYLSQSSDAVELWLQIEDARAVENASAIAAVPGVTGLFVGPQDLAASLGLEPSLQPSEPAFQDALDHLLTVTKHSGVPLGILVPDVQSAERRIDQGFRILAVSSDARLLASGAAALVPQVRTITSD